jgi:6,7-dimethyl-8-ribityllumazine synthase
MRLGIVASRFNEEISGQILARAKAEAHKLGIADVAVESVPGALEIPVALQWLAQSGRFDALVAVGCVIRGDTYHFEIVCNESARGVMDVALDFGLPVANGILTTNDEAQAKARLDKGAEAVRVAVEMMRLRARLQDRPQQ